MALIACNCNCNCRCTLFSVIASVILGVIAAFLQITGIITVSTVILWVAFGIAIAYLAVVVIAAAVAKGYDGCGCRCNILYALIVGALGTILFSLILLAVGIVAESVASAILVGLLTLSFSLIVASTACFAKCLSDCGN